VRSSGVKKNKLKPFVIIFAFFAKMMTKTKLLLKTTNPAVHPAISRNEYGTMPKGSHRAVLLEM